MILVANPFVGVEHMFALPFMRNALDLVWPREGVTRVPYPVYSREDIYEDHP